jgi:hypothetical protein
VLKVRGTARLPHMVIGNGASYDRPTRDTLSHEVESRVLEQLNAGLVDREEVHRHDVMESTRFP